MNIIAHHNPMTYSPHLQPSMNTMTQPSLLNENKSIPTYKPLKPYLTEQKADTNLANYQQYTSNQINPSIYTYK